MCKLLTNTFNKRVYAKESLAQTFLYFFKGIFRELGICSSYFLNLYEKIGDYTFKSRYLKKLRGGSCFDFCGIKIPDISNNNDLFEGLKIVYFDSFFIHCFYKDNYSRENIDCLDEKINWDGPYCYVDDNINVSIQSGDVVIDAGAWIGDFSAYAAFNGAKVYSFEPVQYTYDYLCATADFYSTHIIPVKAGLGDKNEQQVISGFAASSGSLGCSSVLERELESGELVEIVTLDTFVKQKNIEKIDFIKADIEGAERNLLLGASQVLKTFAPKLAICTYHLPDDPEVIAKIILEANPKYKLVQGKCKLFASVE